MSNKNNRGFTPTNNQEQTVSDNVSPIKEEEIKETDVVKEDVNIETPINENIKVMGNEKAVEDKILESVTKERTVTVKGNTTYNKLLSKPLPYEGVVSEVLIKALIKDGLLVFEKDGDKTNLLMIGDDHEIKVIKPEPIKEETK